MKKRIFSILLIFCMLLSVFPSAAAAAPDVKFVDMPAPEHWSYNALSAAVKNGLLSGSSGALMPNKNLSRAEMAAVINRAFGAQEKADISGLTDVPATAWYAADIAKAVHMGTFQGSGGKLMNPEIPITRQEAFAALARAFKLENSDLSSLNPYSDKNQIASWAASALAAMVKAGYIQGSNGKLNPVSFISRAEFAQVMYKMASSYLSTGGTYTSVAEGNVIVNVPGVTLKNIAIKGDLIIGDGVGNGDVILDGVSVQGRLVVRGGGENSIHIINRSDVGSIVVSKAASGGVRIKAEEGCRVEVVYVDDGSDEVILEGTYNNITVASAIPVTLKDAEVTTLSVNSTSAAVSLKGASTVTTAIIAEKAAGSTVTVEGNAKIALVESKAPEVKIQGAGKVTEAKISGNNTAINTKDTEITVSTGTTGVSENGQEVKPVVNNPVVPSETPGGNPGGNPGGGDDTGLTSTVNNAADFEAAVKNTSVKAIIVTGEFTVDTDIDLTKPVTVNAGAVLGIGASTFRVCDTLTNNGTIATVSVPKDGVEGWLCLYASEIITGKIGKIINNGILINDGHVELGALTSVTNNGTFENAGMIHYIDLVGLKEKEPDKKELYEAVRIQNISDNNGKIETIASAYTVNALQLALKKNVPGGDTSYYNFLSAVGLGGTFTPSEDLTVRDGQMLWIDQDTELVIPTGRNLMIDGNGELHIIGTLTVNGVVTNKGLCFKKTVGTINGTITDSGDGKQYNGYMVADNDDWAEACADTRCINAVITGDVTVSENTDAYFNIRIQEDASLTVNEGVTLTVKPRNDEIIGNPFIELKGLLVNNGAITIEPGTGLLVQEGTLENENGIIHAYGWINRDYQSIGGTVRSYANTTDVARVLWHRLYGILPQNVDENTDYETYSDIISMLDVNDTEGKRGLVWLFKNAVLSAENLDPYAYADGTKIGDLLEAFAEAAGKSYTASITGGVATNDYIEDIGNSLDQLINDFTEVLDVSSVEADSEADLNNYQQLNYVEEIHITSDISLADSFTITKRVVIDEGKTLTVAGDKNLTIDWRKDSEEQRGYNGILVVDGTLIVPEGSNVINKCEVNLTGTITNEGTFTNMIDEVGDTYGSNFISTGGTLQNNGTFVTNGHMVLSKTELINTDASFTNNGNLAITGGLITSTGEAAFHNAGYMKVNDQYGKVGGDTVVEISLNGTLTNNSNWIDYTALVYSNDGLIAAQDAQEDKIAELGDEPQITGLETYNRMDIMDDIVISGNITFTGWDVWVETGRYWVEATQEEILQPHTLTIADGAVVTIAGNSLHVNGNLVNEGTLILGTISNNGGLQVWPTGSFVNQGTVDVSYGHAYRMDEYKEDGSNQLLNSGVVTGYADVQDIAIVHDWEALNDAAAAKSAFYERIDVMGEDCDIVIGSDLTISADIYIEWDDGIEIPEGKSLTLTGNHWLNNSGDIWVSGTLNVGSGIEINNDSYIQVDGTVVNDGKINNKNAITLMSGGTITGSGMIIKQEGSTVTGDMGTVSCAYYQVANQMDQLISAMDNGIQVLLAGDMVLTDDLTITSDVRVGHANFENGVIRTGEYTLTIASGVTLALEKGELEVGEGGSVINQGSLTVSELSGIRILNGGTMSTTSDVFVLGWLDLYDWENQDDYLLGEGHVFNYANECELVDNIYHSLYEVDEAGVPLSKKDGIDVVDVTGFDSSEELSAIGEQITGWNNLTEDIRSQYAYAALRLNNMVGNTIYSYEKLTYLKAKTLMAAVAQVLDADISEFLDSVPETNDFICNNNGTEENESDLRELCNGFNDALTEALMP